MKWLGRKNYASALVVVAFYAAPKLAQAGCPNVCQIEVDFAKIEPALECLQIEAYASGCTCSFSSGITNRCAEPVAVVGQAFDECETVEGKTERACREILSRVRAWFSKGFSSAGQARIDYRLVYQGQEYQVTSSATVSEMGSDRFGCQTSRFKVQGGLGIVTSLFFALLLRVRRVKLRGLLSPSRWVSEK